MFDVGLILCIAFLFQFFSVTDNFKAIEATSLALGLNENFTELKSGGKKLGRKSFWEKLLTPILLLIGVPYIRQFVYCVGFSYVFPYLIFKPFILIDAIKTVTLFITYTLL